MEKAVTERTRKAEERPGVGASFAIHIMQLSFPRRCHDFFRSDYH